MRTHVKALHGITIYCQRNPCGRPATRLLRQNGGPITAYCEQHSEEEAERLGIELPEDVVKLLNSGW